MTLNDKQAAELKELVEDLTQMLSECHALDSAAEHYGEEGCAVCNTLEKSRLIATGLFST